MSEAAADNIRRIVKTAPHEFDVNLNVNEYGLQPWFGADSAVKAHGGHLKTKMKVDSHTWEVRLNYEESNILPVSVTPAGTGINQREIREFRITAKRLDKVERKRFSALIRPRWDNMRAQTNDDREVTISTPDGFVNEDTDGVNVRIQSSNIEPEPDTLIALLKKAANAVDINGYYFDDWHGSSTINDMARYVRVHRSRSGPIHSQDGPLAQLGHVLVNDRAGYRKIVQDDTDERGKQKPGYYCTTTISSNRVREVWPTHTFPREIKHYYIEDYYEQPGALRHPKVEVSYQTARWNESIAYSAENIEEMTRQINETIYAVLNEAGLSLRGGSNVYVADEYFEAENHTFEGTVVDLNITDIKHKQESVVFKHVTDGLSPVEEEALETLVTDGGEVSPDDIAADNDRHIDSVYRALRRIDDLLDRSYGEVALKSEYVGELIHDKIQQAREAAADAFETVGTVAEAAERKLDEKASAWQAWASAHLEKFDRHDDEVLIDLGRVEEGQKEWNSGVNWSKIRRILRRGFTLWKEAYQDPEPFRMGKFRFEHEIGGKVVSDGGYVKDHLG